MEENELFIRMSVYELVFEIGVEFSVDLDVFLSFRGEDRAEWEDGDGFVGSVEFRALLGEAFGREDFCIGEGGRPGGEEDVVLEIGGCDVGDGTAEFGERLVHGGG